MCYHVAITNQLELFEGKFKKRSKMRGDWRPRYDVDGFTKPQIPVISIFEPEYIQMFQWHLIPPWAKNEAEFRGNTLNARSDELLEKPTYKSVWPNRCVILVDGFFEPHVENVKLPSESWFIKHTDGSPMAIGGIYNIFKGKPTCTILTTEANEQMKVVHNEGQRMPVILDPEQIDGWLTRGMTFEEQLAYCKPYDKPLTAYRTLDGVYNARKDTNVPEANIPWSAL